MNIKEQIIKAHNMIGHRVCVGERSFVVKEAGIHSCLDKDDVSPNVTQRAVSHGYWVYVTGGGLCFPVEDVDVPVEYVLNGGPWEKHHPLFCAVQEEFLGPYKHKGITYNMVVRTYSDKSKNVLLLNPRCNK